MISIDPFNRERYEEIRQRWDRVAKPLGSLGRFEDITARIGAVHDSADIDIRKRAVIMMCADNGIVDEGISQSGQDVTAAVAAWMGRGESSVCKMAKTCRTDTIAVDVGINMDGSPAGVMDRKVMKGTRNFAVEAAMSEDECMEAIDAGIDVVCDCSAKGYRLLATGEMGIGNTTTSSAIAAALLGVDVRDVTGRGAGLSTKGLEKKIAVIQKALDIYCPDDDEDRESPEFTLRMLSCVGGLDIAALAGVYIGGAMNHIPVIIDGFISAVAALVAERLVPGTKDSMIASHMGREPGMKLILSNLGLEPVIDGNLSLGEGTGAVMLIPLLDAVLALYSDGLNFEETEVGQYKHFDEHSIVLIIGTPDSGKSEIAENIAAELSEPGKAIYLATMIPYGSEGKARIEKHRRMREGKGFITVEKPFDICDISGEELQSYSGEYEDLSEMTVLLECVSNLTANELFERRTPAAEAADRICGDIERLAASVRNLVIVSNHFEKECGFDHETAEYAEILDIINDRLADLADRVIRIDRSDKEE